MRCIHNWLPTGENCERRPMEEIRDQYEIIEEAATDAILTIDEQGHILSISRAAERIFGYRLDEMIGQRLDRIVPSYKNFFEEARKQGKSPQVLEVTGVDKSGKQIQLELSLGEYKKDGRHVYTGIIRDIGPRKDTDRRLAAQFAV